MWKIKAFLFLGSFMFSLVVQAGLGREVLGSSGFHQVCIIDRSFEREQYLDFCTGILIDSKTIVTASHCLKDDKPFEIKCVTHSEGPIASTQTRVQRHSGYGNVDIENTQYPKRDLALIHLNQAIPAHPVKLMSLSELDSMDRCAFFGYSKMAFHEKNSEAPLVQGWQVEKTVMDWFFEDEKIIGIKGLLSPGALLEVGDSGGPLMCESDGQWKLLGISSSRDFSYNSLFASAIDRDLLSSGFSPVVKGEEVALLKTFQLKKRAAISELDEIIKDLERINKKNPVTTFIETLSVKRGQMLLENDEEELQRTKAEIQFTKLEALRHLANVGAILGLEPYSELKPLSGEMIRSTGDLEYNYVRIKSIGPAEDTYIVDLRVIGPSNNFSCKGEILCNSLILSDVIVRLEDLRLKTFQNITFE